jgi:type IV pilus assembly protein PilB
MTSLDLYVTESGNFSEEYLREANSFAEEQGIGVCDAMIELGMVNEHDLMEMYAEHIGMESIDLEVFPVQRSAATSIPEKLAKKYTLIPVMKNVDSITVAMADPININAIEEVEYFSECLVETVLATRKSIEKMINQVYGVYGRIDELMEVLEEDQAESALEDENLRELEAQVQEAEVEESSEGPIAQIINLIVSQAVSSGASDIHMESMEDAFRVRFRIDGIMKEVKAFRKGMQHALIASTKIMSGMDIAESRIPQDGRFRMDFGGRNIDLRVSTFPTMYGEKVVMRILDKEKSVIPLSQLGLDDRDFRTISKVIHKPHGIVLVTGPTGSGKTTTLYSILTEINSPKKNITTLEDPIEYDLGGINQGQINAKKGLTFANGLRSILRQDPDVILVGEIRDGETAEISIQAALTGHLVFSTLHTNDAVGAVSRLIDMGVEPFLVASSLEAVVSQRLVRRLCDNCRDPYTPPPEMLAGLGLSVDIDRPFFRAKGCRKCNRTGYRGRTTVMEMLVCNDELRVLITRQASSHELRTAAVNAGMRVLRVDGLEKVMQGVTSVEEVLRISGDESAEAA